MASRAFSQIVNTIPKRVAELFAFIAVPTGTTPVLQKYNYPQLGQIGGTARTLTAATVSTSAPLGFPQNYQAGTEGIYSVARTATGLWTLTLQDNYQRILSVRGDHSLAGGLANIISVVENPTITNLSSANGSIVGIALQSSSATLADPTAGATSLVRVCITFCDATEP